MVSDQILAQRKKGLEESFFANHNRELLERLRQKVDSENRRESLTQTSGIQNESVVEELVGLGLGSETLAALGLVPLLRVAWADGAVQEGERVALLEAAAKAGVDPGSDAFELFEGWLTQRPSEELFEAWRDYVGALGEACSEGSRLALKAEVLGRAETVARSAGGLLGIGSIAGGEKTVLDELADAFSD